jgi:glycosyltransferase involved in cell wall biosynthesis
LQLRHRKSRSSQSFDPKLANSAGDQLTSNETTANFAAYLREQERVRQFADFIIRIRSHQGKDVLAYGASCGKLDYKSLTAIASQYLSGEPTTTPLDSKTAWLIQLARVAALVPDEHGLAESEVLFELARAKHGLGAFDEPASALYGQVLLKLGRLRRLGEGMRQLRLTEPFRWSLEVDSMNPFTGAGDNKGRWLAQLNTIFTSQSHEPISIEATAPVPFDRLTARASSFREDALVTVIMPTFKPSRSIVTAVRSVIAQSWKNFELLIIDDASPIEYQDLLCEVASMDDRVRVISAPSNGGTYRARNLGLEQASGEYVTFQDSDDWSHPRRIERQVDELRRHGEVLAVRSWAARAFPDLTFTYVGYPPTRPNMSSLLFRREAVLRTVGFFDTARKSADAEFEARLHAAVPGSLLTMTNSPPLAITQLRKESLSRADIIPGWIHWTRLAYRDAYRQWHAQIRQGTKSPNLDSHDTFGRPFPPPEQNWSSHRTGNAEIRRYDVVVLNDWRRGQAPHGDAIEEITAMLRMGLDVAVAHNEAPMPLARQREYQSSAIQVLINDGVVNLVHIEQSVHAGLLLVRNPGALQFLPGTDVALKPDKVVILADRERGADQSAPEYSVAACTVNAWRLFSRRPLWVPRTSNARHALASQLEPDQIAETDLPHAFEPSFWHVERGRPSQFRPIIGRPALDHPDHYPASRQELLAAYPADDRVDVRLLGGTRELRRMLDRSPLPPNWVSFSDEQLSRRTYLAQLDYFVYFHHPDARSLPRTAILEAMASGCVVVLPPHFQPSYGDAALYCQPREVLALVLDVYRSEKRYVTQQRAGIELAARECGTFTQAMESLFHHR